ncbi:MAG: S8 family peptidase [Opitutales bacterium]
MILATLVVLGGLLGYYFSTRSATPSSAAKEFVEITTDLAWPGQIPFESNQEEQTAGAADSGSTFPPGTVTGEYVLHFNSHEDYLAYLAALRAIGGKPLSKIDALLAIRIPADSLSAVNPGQYGARLSYSYEMVRPLPPVEIDPELLAQLRAYGLPARAIVDGVPHGDGAGVLVAILDSGIEAHPQFDDLRIMSLDLLGVGMGGPGAGHGTSVASIIAGKEGIAPQAELIVLRALDEAGLGNSSQVAEGIVQAVDLGARIINLSLGAYQDSAVLRQAVEYATSKGVLLVAAAGNDGYGRLPFPAAYENVLSVTAVDAAGRQAIFPNQSDQIDFAAPGVGIRTAKEDEGTVLFSGTSAAAPFVSGTLASLMSGEKPLSADEAVRVLRANLNDAGAPGADPVYGAGVVDWDRLQERDTPGISDLALASIHLNPDALPGTNMPVEVTVQNRGTTWLNQAQLEVVVNDGEPMRFTIGTLGPGQITTRKVYAQVPSLQSKQTLNLAARVMPENVNEDVRLNNNIKAVQFQPR